MSRVMSFVTMVFIVVPVLAPAAGEAILQVAEWRSIFFVLLSVAIICAIWVIARLPETRPAEDRLPLSASAIWHAARLVTTTRQTIGYVIAMGFVFGLLASYVMSAEQVFVDVYGLGGRLPHRVRRNRRVHDRGLASECVGRAQGWHAGHVSSRTPRRALRVCGDGLGGLS